MIKNKFELIYGGGTLGLMGAVSSVFKQKEKKYTGIVPRIFSNIVNYSVDIVTEDLRERKALMHKKSDAFIALSGGFGTFDEIFETIAFKLLNYHNKPIVFINTNNFYSPLKDYFKKVISLGFASKESKDLYYFAKNSADAIEYILNYKAKKQTIKNDDCRNKTKN